MLKEEVLLKPETFEIIDAYIPVATWIYVLIGIIALRLVVFLFDTLVPNDHYTETLFNMRDILLLLSIPATVVLLIYAVVEGNPFDTDRYRYVVAEVNTNSQSYKRYFNDPNAPILLQEKGLVSEARDKFVKTNDKLYFYMIKDKDTLLRINPDKKVDLYFLEEESNEKAIEQLKALYKKSGQDASKAIFKNGQTVQKSRQ